MEKEYRDLVNYLVEEIRDYFVRNGDIGTKAVIGISGGKDSSVATALCVKALGKENVLGVMLPQDEQHDIEDAYRLIEHLGIASVEMNIGEICNEFYKLIRFHYEDVSDAVASNTPARVRMTMLYAVAATVGGRVINTSNASERYIGYSTKWGDNVGDLFLLRDIRATDVVKLGYELGLPKELVEKVPEDGLSGKTDEENLGFTYEEVDTIMKEEMADEAIDSSIKNFDHYNKIKKRHLASAHKNFNVNSGSILTFGTKALELNEFFY